MGVSSQVRFRAVPQPGPWQDAQRPQGTLRPPLGWVWPKDWGTSTSLLHAPCHLLEWPVGWGSLITAVLVRGPTDAAQELLRDIRAPALLRPTPRVGRKPAEPAQHSGHRGSGQESRMGLQHVLGLERHRFLSWPPPVSMEQQRAAQGPAGGQAAGLRASSQPATPWPSGGRRGSQKHAHPRPASSWLADLSLVGPL